MARQSRSRDRFVTAFGAAVLLLVVLGLATVAQRGGPSGHEVAPEGVQVVSEGSVAVVSGGTVVGGDCVPPGSCTLRTQVSWRLSGLPDAPDGLAYEAVLVRDAGAEPLGPLARQGGRHVLETTLDGAEATALRLVLAGPLGAWRLHEVPLDGATDLAGSFRAAPPGGGILRLEQVGAVTVSLLATAEVPSPPGGVLRAWLVDGTGDDARYESLGAFEGSGDGPAVLDVRRERVERAGQDRFLVTLESGEAGDRPSGFPAFAARL